MVFFFPSRYCSSLFLHILPLLLSSLTHIFSHSTFHFVIRIQFVFSEYPSKLGGYLCLVSLLQSASDTEPRRLSSY